MLNGLEGKMAEVVAEVVASRDGLTVERAAAAAGDPAAGEGVIVVGLTGVEPEAGFEPDRLVTAGGDGPATVRRVLPLRFSAVLRFARGPADDGDPAAAQAAARQLLLDDLALAGHGLGDERVRAGAAFATGGDGGADPGFEVRAFSVTTGTVATEPEGTLLRGELACAGRAVIWPPVPAEEAGQIGTVDVDVQADLQAEVP